MSYFHSISDFLERAEYDIDFFDFQTLFEKYEQAFSKAVLSTNECNL